MEPKIFGLGIFENNIAIYEISALEFLKNEFLPHSVHIGVGFTFSESPAPAFSEGPYPGPGPDSLYNV